MLLGRSHSIREFVELAFEHIGIKPIFKGIGLNEIGYISSCSDPKFQLEIGKEVLFIDPKYFRPTEVDLLIGDPSKAKNKLGWEPKLNLKN